MEDGTHALTSDRVVEGLCASTRQSANPGTVLLKTRWRGEIGAVIEHTNKKARGGIRWERIYPAME